MAPEVKVYGVETADAAGMATSLRAGDVVELATVGLFADGAAVCRAELRPDVASGVFNWEVIVLERQHEYATSVFVGVCAAARARDVGRSTHALYANSGAGCWTINCATGGLWGGGARNAHTGNHVRKFVSWAPRGIRLEFRPRLEVCIARPEIDKI